MSNNEKAMFIFSIIKSSNRRCSVRKSVFRNFAKFIGKHLCQSLFFNKVAGLRPATLLKKKLWQRYFPVNFAEFLRTPFLQNTSRRLLLNNRAKVIYVKTKCRFVAKSISQQFRREITVQFSLWKSAFTHSFPSKTIYPLINRPTYIHKTQAY